MNHFHKFAAVAALAAAIATPVHALTFEGAFSSGDTLVTDYSATGLVSFDIDFANFAGASVEYRVDDVDLVGGPISLNSILRNYTLQGFDGYTLQLSLGSFGNAGTVTRQFGGSTVIDMTGGLATLRFNTPEFLDIEIGNALGTTLGATDWTLAGLQSGDRFTLTVTPVPEPGTTAMLLAGLGAVGFVARRRRV